MQSISRLTILTSVLAAATPQIVLAGNRNHNESEWTRWQSTSNHMNRENKRPALKIALWGDEFYNNDPDVKSNMVCTKEALFVSGNSLLRRCTYS